MFGTRPRAPARQRSGAGPQVTVYGTEWCAMTQMVRRYLDRLAVPYEYRDIERDPAALSQVEWWSGGYASHPTVQIGGDILIEPTIDELNDALLENGVR
ncbi:MAG: glutaredoxin family protein [Rudaea sp.]